MESKQNKGVTLLELMITLGIIAIASSVIWINASGTPNRELYVAANLFVSDVRHAQQMAIQTGERFRIVVSVLDNSYHINRLTYNEFGDKRWLRYLPYESGVIPLYGNVQFYPINSFGGALPHIEFTERGTALSGLTINMHNNAYSVQITRTVGSGRMYIRNAVRLSLG